MDRDLMWRRHSHPKFGLAGESPQILEVVTKLLTASFTVHASKYFLTLQVFDHTDKVITDTVC